MFCKKAQPTAWEYLWRGMTAVFAVIGFFGTLAFLKKKGKKLTKKMEKVGATAYLVNTGWNGTGKRISIKDTRAIIDAILDGSIEKAETKKIPYFDFKVPVALHDVNPGILDPRDTYATPEEWNEKAEDLAGRFIKNFEKFTYNEAGKALVVAGPKI